MRAITKLKILLTIFKRINETKGTAAPVTLKNFIVQFIFGYNKSAYWPVHHSSVISCAEYIKTGIGTAPGLSHGCYIFANADNPVTIGNYTIIAPNAGIAGYNHNLYDYRVAEGNGITSIGDYCWIGMNAVILPGVIVGNHTVVAAGSVVTKSFEQGYVVIAGNPAVIIKELEKEKCVDYTNRFEYIGYLTLKEFQESKDDILKNKK